ncbi:unnamed protein product [Cunninghamella blakesleeana]
MTSGTHIYSPAFKKKSHLKTSNHSLVVLQQPSRASISTYKEKGRKPIEPPPIVQFKTTQQNEIYRMNTLQNPCLFMCANLVHPEYDDDVFTPAHNCCSGNIASSLNKFVDNNDEVGGYFVFGDLSIKVTGLFRLKLSLFEITSDGAVYISSVFTNPFTVYPLKTYPGPLEPTSLSRLFYSQGAKLRIPKESTINKSTLKRKLIDNYYNNVKYAKESHDNTNTDDSVIKYDEQQPMINVDRRHSLTSTEGSGSPKSIHTPLSPEINDLTTPMIINPLNCTKNHHNNDIHRLPSLRDILLNKSNQEDFNLLPPLSTNYTT